MNFTSRPPPTAASSHCMTPAMMMVSATSASTSVLGSATTARSRGSASRPAMMEVTITDIGAVGTEI